MTATAIHERRTREQLLRHFSGEAVADRGGVHLIDSGTRTCRVAVINIDAHDEVDDPEVNWSYAKAFARRLTGAGIVAHSDRGIQYASEHFQRPLSRHGTTCRCGIGRSGDRSDNAPMESCFASLKVTPRAICQKLTKERD